jgi:hypothetical protein
MKDGICGTIRWKYKPVMGGVAKEAQHEPGKSIYQYQLQAFVRNRF